MTADVSRQHFLDYPEAYPEAYMAFGRVAINWAGIEVSLEDILIWLRCRTGTNTMKNWPGGFGQICQQIEDRWPLEEHFAARKNEMQGIVGEARNLHDIRVAVVHGICQGYRSDGRLEFGKSHRREGWAYKRRDFHIDDLNAAADRMLTLHSELRSLSGFVQANWQRKADGTPYYWRREQDQAR